MRKVFFILFAMLFSVVVTRADSVTSPLPPPVVPVPMWCDNGVPKKGDEIMDGAFCDGEYGVQTCVVGEYCIAGVQYSCPAGTYSDEVAASSPDVCQPCPDGTYSDGGDFECSACATTPCDPTTGNPIVTQRLCEIGVGTIKTSTGLSFALYAEKYTEPSLVVGYNGGKCYGKLEAGNAAGTLNFNYNGTLYHLVD